MKRIILLFTLCFGFMTSSFAQEIGVTMATTQNVYVSSTQTYSVGDDTSFTYAWEVYTDPTCSIGSEAGAEVTFDAGVKDAASIKIIWNGPATLTADKDYYLKLTMTDNAHSCANFKILHVVLKATNDMDVVFAATTSEECSVNLSGDKVTIPVTLSGSGFVHRTGEVVSVWYTVNSTDVSTAVEIPVSLTADTDGNYSITIPNLNFIDLNPESEQFYAIRLFKAKDGSGALKDLDGATHVHTRTSYALPTIEDISF